uniref:Uncharacterized protein n=1 Tax=Tetranychus urticae TaxID=32264 RepID=T1KRB1_TETUR
MNTTDRKIKVYHKKPRNTFQALSLSMLVPVLLWMNKKEACIRTSSLPPGSLVFMLPSLFLV